MKKIFLLFLLFAVYSKTFSQSNTGASVGAAFIAIGGSALLGSTLVTHSENSDDTFKKVLIKGGYSFIALGGIVQAISFGKEHNKKKLSFQLYPTGILFALKF